MSGQTEIWELAFTVKRGSNLADRDILANELVRVSCHAPKSVS